MIIKLNLKYKIAAVITLLLLMHNCDSESAPNCFQTSGSTVVQELDLGEFSRILVNRDIQLQVVEAPNYLVRIETGENLLNDVEAKVVDGRLILTDNNSCNLVRDFGITKIVVEAPSLSEIRSSTQFEIKSIGTLNYSNLTLISEDFNETGLFNVGDFRLSINAETLRVISNNISFFYMEGTVGTSIISFVSGAGRYEGANLMAQNVEVFHRGSNDIVVNPQQSLTGELVGTGNLISVNEPPTVAVDELYVGRLFFN